MRSPLSPEEGLVDGCRQDPQSITSDWLPLAELLYGVVVREVRNVPKENGLLTELFRRDWLPDAVINHVFQVRLEPRAVSAWHSHRETVDRLFVTDGLVRIVLYDARSSSPSYQRLNELRFGLERPALVVVPPGVWHGVQNLTHRSATLINLADREYRYEDPDHWRLPPDTDLIPFRFDRPGL